MALYTKGIWKSLPVAVKRIESKQDRGSEVDQKVFFLRQFNQKKDRGSEVDQKISQKI